ncbi:MAG: YigZ family protein [Acholeplasmatales bacterium]|nr:YigZ family protein [Acholeplasmatales bacterium]
MLSIKEEYENEIEILKSRFICHLYPVKNIIEVNNILSKVRKKYNDATHNCYAYVIGDMKQLQKCSDDGEPQKTAGAPMLNALLMNDLTNVLAVVTRYFGGTLLGAGGLTRAYSNSVVECINKANLYELCLMTRFVISIDYTQYSLLEDELRNHDIINEVFGSSIDITLGIKQDEISHFKNVFTSITRGHGILKEDNTYLGLKPRK